MLGLRERRWQNRNLVARYQSCLSDQQRRSSGNNTGKLSPHFNFQKFYLSFCIKRLCVYASTEAYLHADPVHLPAVMHGGPGVAVRCACVVTTHARIAATGGLPHGTQSGGQFHAGGGPRHPGPATYQPTFFWLQKLGRTSCGRIC